MRSNSTIRFVPSAIWAAVVACVFLSPLALKARVTRLEFVPVTSEAGRNGAPSSYQVLRGKAYGELRPEDPHNAIIQDLSLAPRNAQGRVEYVATFTLYIPVAEKGRSGVLVYEVVNRGASLAARDYATGDVFLQSGWQGDIPFGSSSVYGTEAETILVPTAHNPDGSAITGPVLARFANIRPGTTTLPIHAAVGYAASGVPPPPLTLQTADATLSTRIYEDVRAVFGASPTVASNEWAWADCTVTPFPGHPDPTKICMKGGFRPDLLYQLEYTGRDPLILGIGLAAIRDVVSFFRNSAKDDLGTLNPIAGQTHYVLARGISQSGNLLRTFLNLGFNQDEGGREVWDGAMPIIAARQTPINFRFAIPGGASNLYEPGSDGTVWWTHWPDPVRGNAPSGLLDRCEASHTCPKIIEVLGSSEFYALRASPDFVGTGELAMSLCRRTCVDTTSRVRNTVAALVVSIGDRNQSESEQRMVRLSPAPVFCRPIRTLWQK